MAKVHQAVATHWGGATLEAALEDSLFFVGGQAPKRGVAPHSSGRNEYFEATGVTVAIPC